jgi:hypothetical protein
MNQEPTSFHHSGELKEKAATGNRRSGPKSAPGKIELTGDKTIVNSMTNGWVRTAYRGKAA